VPTCFKVKRGFWSPSLLLKDIENCTVRDLVLYLIDNKDMTPQEISDALGGRVSTRTIYRWAKGESLPGNTTDLDALKSLVQTGVVT
jgi:hypothetical protein